jgi:hypothetical protein
MGLQQLDRAGDRSNEGNSDDPAGSPVTPWRS